MAKQRQDLLLPGSTRIENGGSNDLLLSLIGESDGKITEYQKKILVFSDCGIYTKLNSLLMNDLKKN